MKLILILIMAVMSGCATRSVQHHIAAYRECVHTQAMDMIESPDSAEDVARLAASQCQGNLGIINESLREQNAWMERYGSNADGYTEKLREKTNAEVTEEIRKARTK